ncbi:hypothetical protein [Haloarcula sp. 1CSR25-25]|uniref:hypothetical protein n=1 Tax=Haloarcula sp. 1CSR25-25 TaxID=2862545 RepID=UPI002893A79F|nr:hypothetical protein [Haloarcula sp. 1CSR25-25]MDT3437189.1 hypothetical protein [Haloarcula sp. 1CSR25-25]
MSRSRPSGFRHDTGTRRAGLVLVVVTAVVNVRGVVAVQNGRFGTVARQLGAIVFAFGVTLVRYWDHAGR